MNNTINNSNKNSTNDDSTVNEIINYTIKSINKMWFDDFELINNFPKYGNLPSIIWTNLLHFYNYLSSKFPDINDYFTPDTFNFLIIALDSFMLSNPSSNQISTFIKHFLHQSIYHFKLIGQ